ncbi:putative glutathione transferase [Helianthus annuus]|nr:putative glutathione transferase [Helianthus annuus]
MAEDTQQRAEDNVYVDKKKKMKNPWIPDEEKFLATVYLKISENPTVGNGQHVTAFWNRVVLYFRQNTSFTVDRTKDQLTSKWTDMNKKVGKFNEIITKLKRDCKSGQSEEDILPLALTRYKQDVGRDFSLWHVWILLKDSPKWKAPVLTDQTSKIKSKSKRLKTSKTGVYTSSSHAHGSVNLETEDDEVELHHPPGKKSTHQEGKSDATSSSTGSKLHEALVQKEIMDLANGSKVQPDKDAGFRQFHESLLQLTSLELEKREDKDFQFLLMDTSKLTGVDLELVLQRKDRIRKKYVTKYGL